jgi:hypothetical protein
MGGVAAARNRRGEQPIAIANLRRRMPEQDDSKREAPISYRPPKELRAEFAQRVLASGLSTSAFLTKCVFGRDPPRRSRRPSIEHGAVAQILAALAQVRDRLDALNAHLGEGGELDLTVIEETVQPLTEIRALCFKALGRKP